MYLAGEVTKGEQEDSEGLWGGVVVVVVLFALINSSGPAGQEKTAQNKYLDVPMTSTKKKSGGGRNTVVFLQRH